MATHLVCAGLEDCFNARARANNFTLGELPAVMEYIHARGVQGYVALNVLVFDEELAEVQQRVRQIAAAGVDAVIVQVRAPFDGACNSASLPSWPPLTATAVCAAGPWGCLAYPRNCAVARNPRQHADDHHERRWRRLCRRVRHLARGGGAGAECAGHQQSICSQPRGDGGVLSWSPLRQLLGPVLFERGLGWALCQPRTVRTGEDWVGEKGQKVDLNPYCRYTPPLVGLSPGHACIAGLPPPLRTDGRWSHS